MAFPNRCVNCTITFDNPRIVFRGVLEIDSALRDLLLSWIAPVEVLPEHRICEECIIVIRSQLEVDEPSRNYGHKSVCLGCGASVLRARSICLDRSRQEYTIIQSWVPQIQANLPIFTRVCRPCWRRATRAQLLNVDSEMPKVKIEMEENVEEPLHASVGVQTIEVLSRPPTPPPLPLLIPEQNEVRPPILTILLPNYKRVASTSRRCIFSHCLNIDRVYLLIPSIIKQRILIDFNIFIPRCTRICSDHLFVNNEWNNLVNEHLLNTFTSGQIEDMLFLNQYKHSTILDFENIETMNDHIRCYWIGLTVQQFNNIINDTASLTNRLPNYKTSLAMYLTKLRTGDSERRLSSIFGVSKSTFQRKIAIVRECLKQYYVHHDYKSLLSSFRKQTKCSTICNEGTSQIKPTKPFGRVSK